MYEGGDARAWCVSVRVRAVPAKSLRASDQCIRASDRSAETPCDCPPAVAVTGCPLKAGRRVHHPVPLVEESGRGIEARHSKRRGEARRGEEGRGESVARRFEACIPRCSLVERRDQEGERAQRGASRERESSSTLRFARRPTRESPVVPLISTSPVRVKLRACTADRPALP